MLTTLLTDRYKFIGIAHNYTIILVKYINEILKKIYVGYRNKIYIIKRNSRRFGDDIKMEILNKIVSEQNVIYLFVFRIDILYKG